jgi:hypothetical protein
MIVGKSQRFVVLASNQDQAVFFGRDLMLVAHGAPALLTVAPGKRSLGGEIPKFPPLTGLWLPILLSAIIVFVSSSIMHMLLPYHRGDY